MWGVIDSPSTHHSGSHLEQQNNRPVTSETSINTQSHQRQSQLRRFQRASRKKEAYVGFPSAPATNATRTKKRKMAHTAPSASSARINREINYRYSKYLTRAR